MSGVYRQIVNSTTLPGGQELPSGADVTSVAQFDGREVAAGGAFGAATALLPACAARGCNPIVWTTLNGSDWTATWGNNVQGSTEGEQLIAGPGELLLFNDDEATALWYSADAVTWQRVPLPNAMAALGVTEAVWGHGRFVAILSNKYAPGPMTAYGESDTVWTSTDGTAWTLDSVPGPPAFFSSVTIEPKGFRMAGFLRQTSAGLVQPGASAVWTSSDGVTWTTTG